jgi:hypothetical protein
MVISGRCSAPVRAPKIPHGHAYDFKRDEIEIWKARPLDMVEKAFYGYLDL